MGCYADNFSDELNNKRKLDSDFHFHEEEKKTKGKNVNCVHIIELSYLSDIEMNALKTGQIMKERNCFILF